MPDSRTPHYRWEELPKERLSPHLERRLIWGERLMVSHVYMRRDA
jgi:hypothetical protein